MDQRTRLDWLASAIANRGTECIIWPFGKTVKGYGQMSIDRRHRMATHVSLELAGVPRPVGAQMVRHDCDRPSCVNPDHLQWGTYSQNNVDAFARNRRTNQGEAHPRHRLTTANVIEIRARVAEGESRRSISKDYGIKQRYVGKIVQRITWKHI